MATVKELKKKVKSTKSTLKITTAMKLVSAAKLNKAQQAILQARPYSRKLEEMLKTISALAENYSHPFLRPSIGGEKAKNLLLVVSSNKGLCGAYNTSVIKLVRAYMKQRPETFCYFIGKKAHDVLKHEASEGSEVYGVNQSTVSQLEWKEIGKKVADLFVKGEVGHVYIVYNEFKSAISFKSQMRLVLPITLDTKEQEEIQEHFPFDFKYEPSVEQILDKMIPEVFTSLLYTSYLDAVASEHGSRMSSMDSATKNCKEAIRKQTLKMNKLRQAAITTELIEVVSGAESLNG